MPLNRVYFFVPLTLEKEYKNYPSHLEEEYSLYSNTGTGSIFPYSLIILYQLHSSCRFITEPATETGFQVLQLLSGTGSQIHLFFLEQVHSLKDAVSQYSKSKVKGIP